MLTFEDYAVKVYRKPLKEITSRELDTIRKDYHNYTLNQDDTPLSVIPGYYIDKWG